MNQVPKELEQILNSPQAAKWIRKSELLSLLQSPEGQRLAALLQQSNGAAAIQNAAQSAAKGNSKALSQLLEQIKNNRESMELLSKLSAQLQK